MQCEFVLWKYNTIFWSLFQFKYTENVPNNAKEVENFQSEKFNILRIPILRQNVLYKLCINVLKLGKFHRNKLEKEIIYKNAFNLQKL